MGMALLFPEPEYFVPALRAPVPPAAVLQKGPLFAAPVQRYASRLDVAVVTHLVPQLLAPPAKVFQMDVFGNPSSMRPSAVV